jgi:hypothetical protein
VPVGAFPTRTSAPRISVWEDRMPWVGLPWIEHIG